MMKLYVMVSESSLLIMSPAHRSPELKNAVCKDLDSYLSKLQQARDALQASLDQYEDWPCNVSCCFMLNHLGMGILPTISIGVTFQESCITKNSAIT